MKLDGVETRIDALEEADPQAPWPWRSLEVFFGYWVHFAYSMRDLLNRPQDIDRIKKETCV